MCPYCKKPTPLIKRGFYFRPSDLKKVQRFKCKTCLRSFSQQTFSFDFRLRKRHINQNVFRLLCKGVSQRGCAESLAVDPKTIARRVVRFGRCAKKHLSLLQGKMMSVSDVVFDEMESFEHTKLKPLTIPLAVENNKRKILALSVGKIAAKGHLAEISKKKYGHRKCERKKVLANLFSKLRPMLTPTCHLTSDQSKHYPPFVRSCGKNLTHHTFKGRRAAVVGQGEMKKGGFDPLFSLNHTAAMIRDNIKRMARRTWCTTKKIERLLDLLYMYAFYHNQKIDGVKSPKMSNCLSSN